MAGVTEDRLLWPFGTIQTPKIAPARALQLYSIAGANPMFQLLGDTCLVRGPPGVSRPTTSVLPHWSRSMSNASTHSLVRLYSLPTITVVFDPGLACPRKPGPVP